MPSFNIIKPIAPLAAYIRHYWILEDASAVPVSERTLPTGCIQLVFHKGERLMVAQQGALQPRSFICGQSTGFADVSSTGRIEMITAVFAPHAARAFLRVPLHLFHEKSVSVGDIGDQELDELGRKVTDTPGHGECIKLIEEFLVRRLHTFPDYNLKRISATLEAINSQPQVSNAGLAEVACLSSRQLGRIFAEYTGATPKDLMRIVRMQRALYLMQCHPTMSFAQVAYACGFTDQSHMIKEFRLFSGYTPAEYLAACAPHSDYFSDL